METERQAAEMKKGRLAGQVAIVTGACGGIGRATCLSLAREGAGLVLVDLDQDRLKGIVKEIAAPWGQGESLERPLGLALDVRDEYDMEEMARQTLDRFGRIDILVGAAGILRLKGSGPKLAVDMSIEEWDIVLGTNLKGIFLSNRSVLQTMISQRKGSIVNLSSVSGRAGRAYDSVYCASKFGVIGFSEALAEEVRQYNIRVQVVLPDAVDTSMWEQNGPIPRPPSVLPAARVADFIAYLLTLPEDTMLVNPIIAPFQPRRRKV